MARRPRSLGGLAGTVAVTTAGALALGGWGGITPRTGRPASRSGALSASSPRLPARSGGLAALPAGRILRMSADALARQSSLAFAGSITETGERLAFRLRSTDRGRQVAGEIVVRTGSKAVGPVNFVALPGVLYLEAAAPYWRVALEKTPNAPSGPVAAAVVAKLAGKWIEITGSSASSFTSDFGGLTEPGKFAQSLLHGGGTLAKGRERVVRDRRVIPITSSKGGTVFVALAGEPLPVEFLGTRKLGARSVGVDVAIAYPRGLVITAPAGALTLAQILLSLAGA